MERLDFNKEGTVVRSSSTPRSKNSKGRWREIEAIKDKIELQKELQNLDMSYKISSDFEY